MSSGAASNLLDELSRLESLRDPERQGQRQFRRFAVRGDAELYPIDVARTDRQPVDIKLRDIGRGGIGFVCEQPLEVGSNWRCAFLNRGQVISQQAMIVRHCREVQAGLYLIGAQFCLDLGVMVSLGLSPNDVVAGDSGEDGPDDNAFVSPTDVDGDDHTHSNGNGSHNGNGRA